MTDANSPLPNERLGFWSLRVKTILTNLLERAATSPRLHPETLDMLRSAADRFEVIARQAGATHCTELAHRLGQMTSQATGETIPPNLQPELVAFQSLLEGAWLAEGACFGLNETNQPPPNRPALHPVPRPSQPPAPATMVAAPPAAPPQPAMAPPATAPAPQPPAAAAAPNPAPPEEPGDPGFFTYLGTDESPFDDDLTAFFLTENSEHLQATEALVLDLEQDQHNLETIKALFREYHTIKGNSGLLGLKEFNLLTHSFEQYLDPYRKPNPPDEPISIDLLLEGLDVLAKLHRNLQQRFDMLSGNGGSETNMEPTPWEHLTDRVTAVTQ